MDNMETKLKYSAMYILTSLWMLALGFFMLCLSVAKLVSGGSNAVQASCIAAVMGVFVIYVAVRLLFIRACIKDNVLYINDIYVKNRAIPLTEIKEVCIDRFDDMPEVFDDNKGIMLKNATKKHYKGLRAAYYVGIVTMDDECLMFSTKPYTKESCLELMGAFDQWFSQGDADGDFA